ncbi:CPK24, partial [Symbiodinium sp. KB8]
VPLKSQSTSPSKSKDQRSKDRSQSKDRPGTSQTQTSSGPSRHSSLRSSGLDTSRRSPRLKLTCPVKLPSLATSGGRDFSPRPPPVSRQGSLKESQSRQTSDPPPPKPRAATLGAESSPEHSNSLLSTESGEMSPETFTCGVPRLSEAGTAPRGSTAIAESDASSCESVDMSLECISDSDLLDADGSQGYQGPPMTAVATEPIQVTQVQHAVEGYSSYSKAAPSAPPSQGSLCLPKASMDLSHQRSRTWGSIPPPSAGRLTVPSKESPLKRRSMRRLQTMPAGTANDDDVCNEFVAPAIESRPIEHLEDRKIYDVYYWEEVIQEDGDGGKVVYCRKKDDEVGSEFNKVMKIKSKLKLQKEGFATQYRQVILKMLSLPPHPGVMPIEEALEDDAFYYVVSPRATSSFFAGLLVEFQDGVVPEAALRSLLKDILEALDHLHSHRVLHRDIKPDNMVLQAYTDEATGETKRRVVLIDFDHADPDFTYSNDEDRIYGTRRFNAPESYLCCFSKQTDLYSVGAVFYMMMTGKMPYDDEIFEGIGKPVAPPGSRIPSPRIAWQETFQRLKQAEVDWECDPWPSQPVSKDLCKQLLSFSPAMRPRDARAALAHPWFSEC